MKQLYLDIETTGFSRDWNEIIELAALWYDTETNEIIDSFHMYARPAKGGIPANITELTGITNERVFGCGPEWEMLMEFCDWCDTHPSDEIIGHNCKSFDLQFINAKCNRYKIAWKCPETIVDTLAYARKLKKDGLLSAPNMKQTTLGEYFGIHYDAHSALADTRALIKIYAKLKECEKPNRASLGF